jgi:hypothetical protein
MELHGTEPYQQRRIFLRCVNFFPSWRRAHPIFFQVLGWSVLVHVDSLTYRFLGAPEEPFVNVNVTNMVVTPTQTVITAQAGPMQVDLTFLIPSRFVSIRQSPSAFTCVSIIAWRLDQAIDTVLIPFFHCNIYGQFGPQGASVL